jgi:hypothetical protein
MTTVTNIHYQRAIIKELVRELILNKEPFTFDGLCDFLFDRGVSPFCMDFLLEHLRTLESQGYIFYDSDLWSTKQFRK